METTQNWLTVREVASELQVHEETVRRWIRAGELLALELGGPRTVYRIRPADLGSFMRQRTRASIETGTTEPLREPPAVLKQIVERLPIITFVYDPSQPRSRGALLYISPEVEDILGVPPDEWYEDLDSVWPTLMSEEQFRRLGEIGLRLRATREHFALDIRMLNRKTGRPVWVSLDMEVDRHQETGNELWYGLLMDITERKLTEERLRSHGASLNRLAATLVRDLSMNDIAAALFDELSETIPLSIARLHLVNAARTNLTTYALQRVHRHGIPEAPEMSSSRSEVELRPLVHAVLETGDSLRVDDLGETAYLDPEPELRASGARSALAAAVTGQSRTIAVVEAYDTQPNAYRPSDRTYLEAACSITALALARQESRWLTVDDVAHMLDVRAETVRRWIRSGDLVATLPGGVRAGYRVDSAQLDAFIEQRQSGR